MTFFSPPDRDNLKMKKPTIVLDLAQYGRKAISQDGHKYHNFIMYIIQHEFGHALGLDHECDHPDYLEKMAKFEDLNKKTALFGFESKGKYRENSDFVYDPDSIMNLP